LLHGSVRTGSPIDQQASERVVSAASHVLVTQRTCDAGAKLGRSSPRWPAWSPSVPTL